MAKPRLILCNVPYQSESLFHSAWFKNLVDQHFRIAYYEDNVNYLNDTVFVMGCNYYLNIDQRKPFLDKRVIVDALWESNTGKWAGCGDVSPKHHLILYGNQQNSDKSNYHFVPNWFWYNESSWYQYRGYDKYQPKKKYTKRFLMPTGKERGWRIEVINALDSYLNESYWSNVSRGKFLPHTKSGKRMDHRMFHECWYNDTFFSIVLESARSWEEAVCFLTEKIYKPIAFYHPFMLFAAPGALSLLHKQGFETFENLFDESYDTVSSLEERIQICLNNLKQFEWCEYTEETKDKITHNHTRFFNTDVVKQGIVKDIFEPILNYIETK